MGTIARRAEPAIEHFGQRFLRFVPRLRDDHALARRQAIRLQHEWRVEMLERTPRRLQRSRAFVARGGDACALAQVLGKTLAAFELRGGLARPEHRDPLRSQIVRQPGDQRRFGADHDEVDMVLVTKGGHGLVIGGIQRDTVGKAGGTRIARCRVEHGTGWGVGELPCQGMFAAPRAEQKDIHGRFHSVRFWRRC